MTITLLQPNDYSDLLNIHELFGKLSFQNKGYEYIDRSKFDEKEKEADAKVTEILKRTIKGFVRFDNFRLNSKLEVTVRCQYHYSPSFTGVGYVTVRELLNGFDEF